jgi:DNA mismatch endonuclease (patch repair protein)
MGKANRSRDTSPERRLRAALHRRGLRYRVNRRVEPNVPTTVDIAFGPAKVAVFVDGCFWHRCPEHGTLPKANGDWWFSKLEGNVARDRRNDEALSSHGWKVIRLWEHDNPETSADLVAQIVKERTRTTPEPIHKATDDPRQ